MCTILNNQYKFVAITLLRRRVLRHPKKASVHSLQKVLFDNHVNQTTWKKMHLYSDEQYTLLQRTKQTLNGK